MGKAKQRRGATKDKSSRAPAGRDDSTATNSLKPSRQKSNSTSCTSVSVDVTSSGPSILSLLVYLVKALLLTSFSIPFWFLTGILSLIYGRPPKMVFFGQTTRYIRYAVDCKELPFTSRLDLILTIIVHSATSPVSGFCWLLDEILYGKRLNSLSVVEPLFVVSAYRSASTEMARTLAKDAQRFAAPNAIMCAFPYLWLWKVITWIVGDDSGISAEEANGYLNKNFTKESLERHDNDHFAMDTFDGYFLSSHLNGLAFRLGPEVIIKEFNSAKFEECNRYLFEHCFVKHVDRIARKTLLFNNGATTASSSNSLDKTFLLKGHFLSSANALQRKYPDARFLAVLRDPLDRLRSGINHTAVNATLWQGNSPRWDWLSKAFQEIEVEYCEREMQWYGNKGNINDDRNNHRLAVKFDAFVNNFNKTMKGVYRDLLEDDKLVPNFAPLAKVSKQYTVNKSLKELGVDQLELKHQLDEYYAWMDKQ